MLILITTLSTYCTLQERQKSPGPVVDDPGPLAPPPPPGPCKNCIDKCCAAFIICINGTNPSLCPDGLKQCNLDCNMKGCKNMIYHFNCFDPEPSTPPQKGPSPQDPGPQKGPSPQDPGPQKGPSPQDPGPQKDPAGSQGSNSQQPPKGNNVM